MAQTVLITGGSRGIGAACVRTFAENGWNTAFTYSKSREAADRLAGETGARRFWPTSRIPQQWNLRSRKGRHGSARSMPWSAMQASPNRSCSRISPTRTGCACWMSILWVRCARFAPCCLKCCTTTRKHRYGVVHCGENAAQSCREAIIPRARLRLSGLTKSLAQELGPSNIRVNCIAPGVIDTDMNAMHSADTMQELADQTPLGRVGAAAEVADSILYLCSDKSSFITGQVLGVTGGF